MNVNYNKNKNKKGEWKKYMHKYSLEERKDV